MNKIKLKLNNITELYIIKNLSYSKFITNFILFTYDLHRLQVGLMETAIQILFLPRPYYPLERLLRTSAKILIMSYKRENLIYSDVFRIALSNAN